MKVLITGGGGFLGQKLAAALRANPVITGKPVSGLTLADLATLHRWMHRFLLNAWRRISATLQPLTNCSAVRPK